MHKWNKRNSEKSEVGLGGFARERANIEVAKGVNR